jgi:NADH:ubiquinone oxidoreductase subunit C
MQKITENYGAQVSKVIMPRERRIFLEASSEYLVSLARSFRDDLGMANLGTITGLDDGEHFEIIYHFYNAEGLMLNLKIFTPRDNPRVPTITEVYPGAFLYERELMDLFGIVVEGTPPGRHYPLPEDWPAGEYPLRKDWKGLR